MSKKKTKALRLKDLKKGEIYWSILHDQCIILLEFEDDCCPIFKFTLHDGYCAPIIANVSEAPELLKLLFSDRNNYDT